MNSRLGLQYNKGEKKMKKIIALLLSLTILFSMAGCGSKQTTQKNEKPYEGTTLNLIISYGGAEKTFEDFTEKTGIKIEFVPMSSGEALAKLVAEDGKTNADIWLGGGVDSFIEAKKLGYIEPYISPEATDIKDMYKDKEGYWTGVSLQCAGFIVNNDLLKEKGLDAPKTWEDLADPKYKGELIMANPAISGTYYAMLSGLIQSWGEEKAWDYFKKLNDNVNFYAAKGGEPPKKIAAGEFAVGVTPMTGEYFKFESTYPVTVIYPEDLLPWTPAPVSIFKNTKNLEAAKVFVDYILSKEGQESLRDADPRIMVRDDVAIPADIKNVDVKTLVNLNVEAMGSERKAILDKWKGIVGDK